MVRWRLIVLAAAGSSLALGLYLPIMRVERLFVFTDSLSVLGLLAGLWREGEWALAVLVGLFSVVFPLAKLALLCLLDVGSGVFGQGAIGRALPHLSKWSMIDVMLVAIAIFAAKSSGLASAVVEPGLWFYAASAILTGLMMPTSRTSGRR